MNVIVSMQASGNRKVYHRQNCMYANRIRRKNKMILSRKKALRYGYCSCQYCGGLRGEVRTGAEIPVWEKKHHICIDYVRSTDTLYVRTDIGCWKIFCQEELQKYVLYHRNFYSTELSLEQAISGNYHRQKDVPPQRYAGRAD